MKRSRRASGGLQITGDVPTLVYRATAPLSQLQDARGYLWFVAGGDFDRYRPDIPWGYNDRGMCDDLRRLGAKKFLRQYVFDRVDSWYWQRTIDAPILRRLFGNLPVTTTAIELADAAQRINLGVYTPFGRRVFGMAEADIGFSVPGVPGNNRFGDGDGDGDDRREDVMMFWQDAMMSLGHRNGPALIAHQICQRLEGYWAYDIDGVEQLAALLSQGAFDAWAEGPAESFIAVDVSRYGGDAVRFARLAELEKPLRDLMRSIRIDDPPWMLYRFVMLYVRALASVLMTRDEYPNFAGRGVVRSCRGRV